MLELTIRDPGSLLSIVYRRQIDLAQLEEIRRICERNPLREATERKHVRQGERPVSA